MLHGLFGQRTNWNTFAQTYVHNKPDVRFLLVDLRNHGASAQKHAPGEHTLENSAEDIAQLIRSLNSSLKIVPDVVMGHSLGGKIAWKLAEKILPKQLWLLDSFPGTSNFGEFQSDAVKLLPVIKNIPLPIPSRKWLRDELVKHGFNAGLAAWFATNLMTSADTGKLTWKFNYNGINDMFMDYLETSMWSFLDDPGGIQVHFVVAEKSDRWNENSLVRFNRANENSKGMTKMHILKDSGHWVHLDNPTGLYSLFDLHLAANKVTI